MTASVSDPRKKKAQRPPRADILRFQFRGGKASYECLIRDRPRWTIDHVGFLLTILGKDYDPAKIGCQKRRFTKQHVFEIVWWVLYGSRPPLADDDLRRRMTQRQAIFFQHFLTNPACLGNATRAARLAGYRHPEQRGYELWKALRHS